jgi:hypothetical protein
MITVGTTVVSGSPINGGGGGGVPLPSTDGYLSVTSGAYDTPSSASDIVAAGISSMVGSDPAGTAIVSDGTGGAQPTSADVSTLLGAADAAAARAALSAEILIDPLPVASALHHWRLGETSSPFADSGSSPVNLAYVSGNREYGRAGAYARYGATKQRSTGTVTNRAEAVISDVASGVDLTVGVSFANETGTILTPATDARIIAALHDGGVSPISCILILTNASGNLYIYVSTPTTSSDIGNVPVDWSRSHRVDVTRVHSTGDVIMYVDGISRATGTIGGTMAALTRASIGSVGQGASLAGVNVSELLTVDFTVHTSALSAATVLTRADASRRLSVG